MENKIVWAACDKHHIVLPKIEKEFATKADYEAWADSEREKIKADYDAKYGEGWCFYDTTQWILADIVDEFCRRHAEIDRVRPVYPAEEIARLAKKSQEAGERLEEMLAEVFGEPEDDEVAGDMLKGAHVQSWMEI